MAVAFVQSGSAAQTASTTPSVTLGAAPIQGNLLVAVVSADAGVTSFTASGTWTKVASPNVRSCYAYKVAGASESATQTPLVLGAAANIITGIAEYSGLAATSPLDVSGTTADATSPQDQAAINPTDNITTLMVGLAASDSGARTFSGQTIGGSAATERLDAAQGANASMTIFDRLNVATSTSTFAAQTTVSGAPGNGTIALLIFTSPAAQTVNPSAIASTAALSAPGLAPGAVTLSPASIDPTASFGVATASPGTVSLSPASIDPTASFGSPTIVNGTIVLPASLGPTATVAAPTLTVGAVSVSPAFIPSHASFGALTILDASLIPGVGTLVATDAALGLLVAAAASRGSVLSFEATVGRLVATSVPVPV